jgi:DNA polymerase-3 subunit delta'
VKILENIVGQPQVVSILEKAIQASRNSEDDNQEMTHSWLFAGPPGSGKSVAAMAFAAALVCPNDGCGECIDCKTAIDGSHLDIEIFKTEGLSIKIDEVRELISRSATSPSISSWRIVLIQDIQRLTEAAANALLKAIEEPSSRTVWLLTATSSIEVLPTIGSRCRYIQLKTPTKESIVKLLTDRNNIDPQLAEYSARVSQGHIGRAIFISQNPNLRTTRNEVIELILTIKDTASAFLVASKLIDMNNEDAKTTSEALNEKEIIQLQNAFQGSGRGLLPGGSKAVKDLEKIQKTRLTRSIQDSLDRLLLDILSLFRDILIIQLGKSETIINIERMQLLQNFALNSSQVEIYEFVQQIMRARESLRTNGSSLLVIENLMIEIVNLVPKR